MQDMCVGCITKLSSFVIPHYRGHGVVIILEWWSTRIHAGGTLDSAPATIRPIHRPAQVPKLLVHGSTGARGTTVHVRHQSGCWLPTFTTCSPAVESCNFLGEVAWMHVGRCADVGIIFRLACVRLHTGAPFVPCHSAHPGCPGLSPEWREGSTKVQQPQTGQQNLWVLASLLSSGWPAAACSSHWLNSIL
jgi:hypothetical protein